MSIIPNEVLRKQVLELICPVPHKSLSDVLRHDSRPTWWKSVLLRALLPGDSQNTMLSAMFFFLKKSICTFRKHPGWTYLKPEQWLPLIDGVAVTFIFFFKLVFNFKSSWQWTLVNNQEEKFSWSGEAISIHRFVHPGKKIITQKAELKMGIPKCCLEISGSSKELNKRWKIGEGPLLNLKLFKRFLCAVVGFYLSALSLTDERLRSCWELKSHSEAPNVGIWWLLLLFCFNGFVYWPDKWIYYQWALFPLSVLLSFFFLIRQHFVEQSHFKKNACWHVVQEI